MHLVLILVCGLRWDVVLFISKWLCSLFNTISLKVRFNQVIFTSPLVCMKLHVSLRLFNVCEVLGLSCLCITLFIMMLLW